MELLAEPLPGLRLLRNRVHLDARGSFTETYNRRSLTGLGIDTEFVQDNESVSTATGTVRGLHLQIAPDGQGKLIRVLSGAAAADFLQINFWLIVCICHAKGKKRECGRYLARNHNW